MEKPYREELSEDLQAALEELQPKEALPPEVAEEVTQVLAKVVKKTQDMSGLAKAIAGLPTATHSIVKEVLLVVQEKQRLRLLRKQEEELMLLF